MKAREYALLALLLLWASSHRPLSGSVDVQLEITEPGFEGTVIYDSDSDWPPRN